MDTNYVVIEGKMIIFPSCLTHVDVAEKLRQRGEAIDGAGFISFDMYGNPRCSGKSVSLKIDSRHEKDEHLAKRLMGRDSDWLVSAEDHHRVESEKAKRWDEHCAKQKPTIIIEFIKMMLEKRRSNPWWKQQAVKMVQDKTDSSSTMRHKTAQ